MIKYSDEIKSMNLWEKISQISSEVEYLQKDDSVGFGSNSYKAISIEKVVTAVSDKMNKYGIVIYPTEQLYSRKDEEVTKRDGTQAINRISDVDVKYQVVNIHNPQEQIITVSSGTGVDTQDKGIGKAMTYAYKNMIIKLFSIATGDDTDKIHSDDYTNKLLGDKSSQNPPQQAPIPSNTNTPNRQQNNSYSQTNGNNLINEKQQKMVYAKSKTAGLSTEQMKTIMAKHGFNSSKEITKDKLQDILNEIG